MAGAGTDDIAVSDAEREAAIHAALNPEVPRPWVRFWARAFDFMLFTTLVVIIVGLSGAADPALFVYPMGNNVVHLLSVHFAWIFVEAALLSQTKTTPGKALLNIRLRREDGGALTSSQALRRSFSVWWRGTGFGIVPLLLIGCALSNLSLSTRGKTPWDLRDDLEVKHSPIAPMRIAIYIATLLVATSAIIHFAGEPPMPQQP